MKNFEDLTYEQYHGIQSASERHVKHGEYRPEWYGIKTPKQSKKKADITEIGKSQRLGAGDENLEAY